MASDSSKKSLGNRKGMSNPTTRTADTSGSRHSAQDASSGQGISSPSNIRKSVRLEKQAATTPPVTRKSERLVKQNAPSPLRRSNRSKICNLSSPLRSKQSEKRFSSSEARKKKDKKDKSVKQLTAESVPVISSEKHDQESISLKRKRMDARSYKALFKTRRRDPAPDSGDMLEKSDALPQIESSENGGTDSKLLGDKNDYHQCGHQVVDALEEEVLKGASESAPVVAISGFRSSDADVSGNDIEEDLSYSICGHSLSGKPPDPLFGDDIGVSMIARTNGENFDDTVMGQKESSGDDPGSESIDHHVQVKNKTSAMSIDSNVTAAEIVKDISASVAEANLSASIDLEKHDFLTNNVACLKRQSKLQSSKFMEYWVPVELSNLQLEQYCATLLTNSISLRSYSKTDHVGAVRETLMTIRKCCDHPYLVDSSLEPSIIKGLPAVEILNVGIKASGKLQLLDRILSESKSQKLRVLILFQSIGSGGVLIGDILDEFLSQRFGPDSYERVDACVAISKKLGALSRFNQKGSEQFVFLLENRCCHSSIKLLAVDIIVIFDSEWTPANDLKALHRISIDTQREHINIFRLYSSYTIEEKVLILGEKNLNLDSNLQNISRSMSDTILRWGVSSLFSRLDKFHAENSTTPAADVLSGQSLLDDVVKDFLAVLSDYCKNIDEHDSVISKVFRSAGFYHTNSPLLGERKILMADIDEPQIFWKKLLEGRNPHWKYLCRRGPTPRNRKRVLYGDISPTKSTAENEVAGNKYRKVGSVDAASIQPHLEEGQVAGSLGEASVAAATNQPDSLTVLVARGSDELNVNNATNSFSDESSFPHQSSKSLPEVRSPSDEQKSLHVFLIAEMAKLCEVLTISKDVKHMVGRFLEYVVENHHVNKEPTSILQAFQMSLCWIAGSILKQKIARKDSLMLARQNLNFQCTEEEANHVYVKLRSLKKKFMQLPGNISDSISSKNFVSAGEDIAGQPSNAGESLSVSFNPQNVGTEIEERSLKQELSQGQSPNNKVSQNKVERRIKKIQKKCDKRRAKLCLKHQQEVQKFHNMWMDQRGKLEEECKLELALIQSIHCSSAMGMDKLKLSDNEFAKKMGEHVFLKQVQLKELEAKHAAEMEEEMKKSAKWLAEVKSCHSQFRVVDDLLIHGSESEHEMGFSMAGGPVTCKRQKKDGPLHGQHLEEQTLDKILQGSQSIDATLSDVTCTVTDGADACGVPAITKLVSVRSTSEKKLETPSFTPGVEEPKEVNYSSHCTKKTAYDNIRTYKEQIADDAMLSNVPEIVTDGVDACSGPAETSLGSVSSISEKELEMSYCTARVEEPEEANHSSECARQIASVNSPTSKEQIADKTPSTDQNNEIPSVVPGYHGSQTKHSHSVETSSIAESHIGKDKGNTVSSSITGNQEVPLDSSSSEGIPPAEPPSFECLHNRESMDLRDENVQVIEKRAAKGGVACSTAVDDEHTLQSHCDAQIIENSEQLQPASNDLALDGHQPLAAESSYQGHSWGANSLQNSDTALRLVAEPVELSQQSVSHDEEDMRLHPSSVVSEPSSSCNPPDSQAANRSHHEPNSEQSARLQSTMDPSNVAENADVLPYQDILQSGHILPILGRPPNCVPLHHAYHVGSWNITLSSHSEPLQNDIERLHKEIEQAIKVHDNTKLLLKSACEKEIEEMVAQIHAKYEAKLKDADAAFSMKKTELDSNMNMILVNKILAEAVRSKCLDIRTPGISGIQQVMPSSFMQHLHQSSLPPMMRHSPVAIFSSASQPANGQQIVSPSVQSTQHSSGTLLSVRPPQIGAITPAIANARVGGDIWVPAPHLQPIGPPAYMSSTNVLSLPCNIPDQQVTVTSPLLPPRQPEESMLITRQSSHQQSPFFLPSQPPQLPILNMNQFSSNNRPPETEAAVLPGPNSSSLSALQLLRDVHSKQSVEEPHILPHSTDFGSKNDALNLSNHQTVASPCCIGTSSALDSNVVCLSDDDD